MNTTTPARKWFTAMWISFASLIVTMGLMELVDPDPMSAAGFFINAFGLICVAVTGASMVACLFYWIARGQ
jgi:hypothetical protein